MRRSILFGLVMLFSVGLFVFMQAQDKKMKMKAETIEGTLVDSKCFSMGGMMAKGNDHPMKKGGKMVTMPGCATACATMGIPVAVLDGKGNVHVLALPAKEMAQYMAQEVKVTGMHGQGGDGAAFLVEKLAVKEDGKWVDKTVPGTMM